MSPNKEKEISIKKPDAYDSLNAEEKLIYEYCLYLGADNKTFELDYDKFLTWMAEHPDIMDRIMTKC